MNVNLRFMRRVLVKTKVRVRQRIGLLAADSGIRSPHFWNDPEADHVGKAEYHHMEA